MRVFTVASLLVVMALVGIAGCAKPDDRLPQSVTNDVMRDFNEGDALRTAGHYANNAQILSARASGHRWQAGHRCLFSSQHRQVHQFRHRHEMEPGERRHRH